MSNNFTAHNILLDDGSQTLPSTGWIMSDHPVFKSAQRILNLLFPDGFQDRRIVDLGCLEGGHTVEFARIGLTSVGIEIRKSNYANCMYVKERVNLPNLHFINDTVWNIQKYGPFDVIFCAGLLYHLEKPREFLYLISKFCRKAVIFHTHFATIEPINKFNLSDIVENEGIHGRWYLDHDEDDIKKLDEIKWASWENKKSFWIQKEYLIQEIKNAGFDLVFEQYDWMGNQIAEWMISGLHKTDNQGMFVGIKSDSLS